MQCVFSAKKTQQQKRIVLHSKVLWVAVWNSELYKYAQCTGESYSEKSINLQGVPKVTIVALARSLSTLRPGGWGGLLLYCSVRGRGSHNLSLDSPRFELMNCIVEKTCECPCDLKYT